MIGNQDFSWDINKRELINNNKNEIKEYRLPFWTTDNKIRFINYEGQSIDNNLQNGVSWQSHQLWEINSDGSKLEMLFDLKCKISTGVWSPNGQKLALIKENEKDLWILSLNDFSIKKVTSITQNLNILGFSWSPDSKTLAYCIGKSVNFITL